MKYKKAATHSHKHPAISANCPLKRLRDGQPVSLTEISDELELNQATAANIITTMVSRGYIEHIGKKKGYRLGPAAYRLTNEIPYEQDLVIAAREVMEELTAKVNESCILGVLRNNKRYILHAVNAVQEVQVQLHSERNIYETATGRLLLAYLSEKDLGRFIQHSGLPDAMLWPEAHTKARLEDTLKSVKNSRNTEGGACWKNKHPLFIY